MRVALILSGGVGSRVGGTIPKQYLKVRDRMIIEYCLDKFIDNNYIDTIQIVAAKEWQECILNSIMTSEKADGFKVKFKGFSEPGENRQLSIYNGLKSISEYAEDTSLVMIHDAARPNLSSEMIERAFETAKQHDGVLPVIPMKDTVYYSESGTGVDSLLDRSKIFAGQAPEIFTLGKYIEANERLIPTEILKINGSTEPAIMAGLDVAMIPGDENNYKITTRSDLERFENGL